MRKLTFKGFIETYIMELSYLETTSIRKLITELDSNPRLKEPLILHAIVSGMPSDINKKNPVFYQEYIQIKHIIKNPTSLELERDNLPEKYKKVIDVYEYKNNRTARDNDTKSLMRNKIIQLQQRKDITNYKIYKALGLNHGNVNCFIKNGELDKLSLNSVRMILDYAKNY